MARDQGKRWKCDFCGEISLETDLLIATNPFDKDDDIIGCPHCKQVSGFDEMCDEPGCQETAGCGFPVDDPAFGGYRRTCHKHCNN
jgi:hypothetical protein